MTATTFDRRPLVLVDMDGVQADLEAHFWKLWATWHPNAPQRQDADPAHFYIEDQLPAAWRKQARAILDLPGFYRDLPPIPGAADALNAMLEIGWDVAVCTAPLLTNPTCASDKLDWLEEHIGPGWARRAVIAKDKSLVSGDVLIDDKPAIRMSRTPTWAHVVFDTPYNRHASSPHRLRSWDDWHTTLTPLLERAAA